ncbi:MAG: septum formation initiator family protein [Spirochaetales bacterium]|nr:septum formation initiator family protein [Spirochaetales bacterium]
MKWSIFLFSLLIGLSVYSVLIFAKGDTGLSAMEQAESYKNLLSENLDEIREINRELTVDFDALSSDEELIKLKARALGYYEAADHLVHIVNWNPDANEYKPGFIVKRDYKINVDEKPFRILGLTGALSVMIAGLTLNLSGFRRNRI